MRSLYLFMMISLDGYFEGPDHDLSWHNVDAEFNGFATKQLAETGTLLFGKRTYELMAGYWPTPQGSEDDLEVARFMNGMEKFVFSHDPYKADWEHTTAVTGKAAVDAVRRLKAAEGRDIAIFGSNNLCVSLMEEGLVDEFRIMINPVAIGKGTPLFTGLSKKIPLTLIKTKEFKSGNVLHTYRRKG